MQNQSFCLDLHKQFKQTENMKNKIFKVNQKVKVIKSGSNASQFNYKIDLSFWGVYQLKDWDKLVFEIEGTIKLCDFDRNPEIFGAYLLSIQNIPIGYVYNNAINEIDKEGK